MKKTAILVGLILCFILQNSALAADVAKVAIVDLQRCMRESNEGKRVSESLQKEKETRQQRINNASKELSTLEKEIEKQSLMLSQEAKTNKENEYNKKKRELTYLQEDMEEEQEAAEQNATQKILQEIYAVVDGIGKKGTFDLALEKSSAGIIFASGGMDITDQVITEFNKAKP